MTLNVVDISQHNATFPNLASQDSVILRASLGTILDKRLHERVANLRHSYPGMPFATYTFLAGPRRGIPIARQMAFYAEVAPYPAGAIIDWEDDTYRDSAGDIISFGRQPFSAVIQAVDEARRHGMDPGVYASRSLLTEGVVKALVARHVPLIWCAAYDGLKPFKYILDAPAIIGHQYTGTGLDRSWFYTNVEGWREFCRFPSIDPPVIQPPAPEGITMFNLFPVMARRVADFSTGTELLGDNGEVFQTLKKPVTLGLLMATGTHYVVANGDRGLWVLRGAAQNIRAQDQYNGV